MIEYCRAYIYTCAERGEKEVMVIESDRESGKERKKKKYILGVRILLFLASGK